MLKVLIDFLASNWLAFLQAPLTFTVVAIIGFVAGNSFAKSQNDTLKERLQLREDQLKKKNDEIKSLNTEVEKLHNQQQTPVQVLGVQNTDYENYLSQLSNIELSREAQKMAGKLEISVQLSQERQDPGMSSMIETGLYNEWLSEGPKLLAIKHETLKRLPPDARFSLDRVSDSRYTSPAFQAYSIMDAVNETKSLGLKVAEYDPAQA